MTAHTEGKGGVIETEEQPVSKRQSGKGAGEQQYTMIGDPLGMVRLLFPFWGSLNRHAWCHRPDRLKHTI
jgi:hypothetical protein